MKTEEFLPYFKKIPYLDKHFLGVFAIDEIPHKIEPKSFFVCNTDPSHLKGKHWIAFICLEKNNCEIFDSLGLKKNEIEQYFNFQQKMNFIYNTTPVQSISSKLCGFFVVTFVIERMLNQTMDFDEIIENIFSHNQDLNDKIVTDFCSSL